MSGNDTIAFLPTVEAAVVAVGVGAAAFWSNPRRTINRAFFVGSLHVALWLLCLELALRGGVQGRLWMRATSAVGAFIPLQLWAIKETIVSGESIRVLLARSWRWMAACAALAGITLTEWYVATNSSREASGFRWGFFIYILGVLFAYSLLCYRTAQQMRDQHGLKRMELQIVLLGGSATAGIVLTLMAMRAVLQMPFLIRLQPLVVLTFYTGMVIAITTSRVFNARQVVIVCAEKTLLVLTSAGIAYALNELLAPILPSPFDFLATTALTLWFASSLNGWLNQAFQFYPQATSARQAAFAAAGKEAQIDKLELAFLSILKGWGQTDHALVLSGSEGAYQGGGVEVPADSSVAELMKQIRWATPERLARERPTPARVVLAKLLTDYSLGVLVHSEGPTLSALVGVGVAASRRPFTYPQVLQLLELAAIIENALERAHLSAKAQHAEQLATVGLLGASLAHEIRNPLVSIKTFVQLLPDHYQDQAFRDKFFRLISDEVTRIDRLTEQLLDLASPRVYSAKMIELHTVLRESVDLVASKAAGKNVELRSNFQATADAAHTDPAAVKQVLLNLCFNAIQAVETQFGEKWVQIETRNTQNGIELSVSDSGPGISSAIWPRLFQPFQSTKSSGFGLGLAICKDILTNLNATISVDQPAPGRGATFRVTFPCRP